MKTAISGTWITQLVILFMFVMVGFLILSLNYSKAFRVKNETLTFIEKYQGLTKQGNDTIGSIKLINNFLKNSKYTETGSCEKGWYGININSETMHYIDGNSKNEKYSYCVAKISSSEKNFSNRAYYEIKLFFKYNLPVLGYIYNFEVDGQTKTISLPRDGTCYDNKATSMKCLNRK